MIVIAFRTSLLVCLIVFSQICFGQSSDSQLLRNRLKERFEQSQTNTDTNDRGCTKIKIAGLDVAVWKPVAQTGPAPLVVFSHGFSGSNTQSCFLMKALADAGYVVMAPNHQDASGAGNGFSRPEVSFMKPTKWSDKVFKQRADDVTNLLAALRADKKWNSVVDWDRIGLAGHSLGGYTVLGLAGAWPTWKIPGVKAVLAISPYCEPFVIGNTLGDLHVPVLYEGGTRDMGITPFVERKGGAYDQTSAPAVFVDFKQAGHLSFTDFNRDSNQKAEINKYCVAFLDKYLKGTPKAKIPAADSSVSQYRSK